MVGAGPFHFSPLKIGETERFMVLGDFHFYLANLKLVCPVHSFTGAARSRCAAQCQFSPVKIRRRRGPSWFFGVHPRPPCPQILVKGYTCRFGLKFREYPASYQGGGLTQIYGMAWHGMFYSTPSRFMFLSRLEGCSSKGFRISYSSQYWMSQVDFMS